ncbi:hypothetical protein D3C71_1954800 [compost metagenome]
MEYVCTKFGFSTHHPSSAKIVVRVHQNASESAICLNVLATAVHGPDRDRPVVAVGCLPVWRRLAPDGPDGAQH